MMITVRNKNGELERFFNWNNVCSVWSVGPEYCIVEFNNCKQTTININIENLRKAIITGRD